MKRLLPVVLFLLVLRFCDIAKVDAQVPVFQPPPISYPVKVSAQVGEFYLNISGYTSPYASIIMTSNGQLIRSTVADGKGNFFISQILVNPGFSEFCLDATDFKRLGDSEACLKIEPVYTDRTIKDIFLPPTIGLLKVQLNEGENAVIYGYSVPHSTVIIKTKDGNTYTVQTDGTGYYSYTITNAKSGTYVFSASGRFKEIDSLPPTKNVTLNVLSLPTQISRKAQGYAQKTTNFLTQTIIGFLLLLLLLILIIVIILILILRPGILKTILDKLKRRKGLHHDWFLLVEN